MQNLVFALVIVALIIFIPASWMMGLIHGSTLAREGLVCGRCSKYKFCSSLTSPMYDVLCR